MRHEKNTSLIETTLFQCRSHKHWRRINVDQTMLQPCMPAKSYSGEFVLRLCLLGAFNFFCPYLFINRSFFKTNKWIFSLLLFLTRRFGDQKLNLQPSRSRDREFDLCPVPNFPGNCPEIISTASLLLPLIQEGLLLVTSERMCTNLVKLAQEKVWLGELTVPK